ncbi:hypothetical protein BDC45DRAFT_573732 [Circinella umbellata]|nr:hypothetical protein BDC45DRAFT_573732 [Circinella umbellata]
MTCSSASASQKPSAIWHYYVNLASINMENASKQFPTIIPIMVLADLPSMQSRSHTLQLKFLVRLQLLPDTVKQKRSKEYTDQGKNRKRAQCLRTDCRIDPTLYLPVTSIDRHRLIKWRMHWLPSYPLQGCCCGARAATREHYTTCSLLQHHLQKLLEAFGPISNLVSSQQPTDHILNKLPRSEVGLTLGKWQSTWPALLHVLWEIDRRSHPADTYNYVEEPALKEALQAAISLWGPVKAIVTTLWPVGTSRNKMSNMVTPTQNKLSFNNDKIVIDTNKLQSLLTKHSINVISFSTEKQNAASKASLKSANTERTTECVRRTIERVREENAALKKKCHIYDTYYEKENVNSEDKSMKNQDSQDKFLENKDSRESSIPHISDAMLGGNTSSAATSQGGSDSGDECESGEGEFMSMIACKPYRDNELVDHISKLRANLMKKCQQIYIQEEINKNESDYSNDSDEYSDDN